MSTETQLILTNREREVLAIAWQCFTTDPKVDMPKFIAMTGGKHIPNVFVSALPGCTQPNSNAPSSSHHRASCFQDHADLLKYVPSLYLPLQFPRRHSAHLKSFPPPSLSLQHHTLTTQYTKRSAETTLSVLKKRLRDHVSHVSQDNPAPLAVKGRGRRPAAKKRAAKDADDGAGEDAPRPKKRGKKAAMGPELTGEEADTMMGLGGREEEKVKEEPEDVGFGWGVDGDEVEDEI
ncbi:hypothetical protein E8E12_009981 [Didymella heteroderae]|uniref:Uncharacterized protein n=1 Tax=Didymella heteroderae TaxID=1769908 RepID=A0A9P5C5Q7_9PLEO|nr:hypothetical protein E8E12_009981 [Didymella heteroderae]